jgi:DNA polymerase
VTDRGPTSSRDDLAGLAARFGRLMGYQEILREGKPAPRESTAPAPAPPAPAPAPESPPTPAARVVAAPPPGAPAPAAIVEAGWRRDPSEFATLGELHDGFADCGRCSLARTRTHLVFGVGNPEAGVMFVGEAPGRDEDLQGEPFVGKAGQLLNRILAAIDLRREDVYIANILKCRPPGNRDPKPDEIAACSPVLARQIELIRPLVLCTLGAFAARTLLGVNQGISRLRGRTHRFRGIPVIPTYHPAALLRNPAWKRPTWEDVQRLRALHDQRLAESGRAAEATS